MSEPTYKPLDLRLWSADEINCPNLLTDAREARKVIAALAVELKEIEAHHEALNDEVGRDQGRSKTLRHTRAALAITEPWVDQKEETR